MFGEMITQDTNTISLDGELFFRAVETAEEVFFVNYEEGDENGQVMMFGKKGQELKLISDNYFASVGLNDALRKNQVIWLSDEMKEIRHILILEEIIPVVEGYLGETRRTGNTSELKKLEDQINEFYIELPSIQRQAFLQQWYQDNKQLKH